MSYQSREHLPLPYSPERPRNRTRFRLLLIAGVAIALVMVIAIGGVSYAVLRPSGDETGVTTAATTSPAPSPTPTPTPSPTPPPSPSSGDTSGGPSGDASDESGSTAPRPGATTYLDSVRTLAGSSDARPVAFSGKRYSRGVVFFCASATSSYVQWNVAGSARFTATSGIDDNTQGAFGKLTEMTFYDQDGRALLPQPVVASVGHPQDITIDLTGVVSLRMTCAGRDSRTNRQDSVTAALGDPLIVRA
jgi:hypothetical protein